MRYRYSEWDGGEFPTQDSLGLFDDFLEMVLTYGDRALEALEEVELDDEQKEWLEQLLKEGLLERVGVRWRLTPRAIQSMQRRALMEVFARLKRGGADGHETTEPGAGGERTEGTKRYQYGDPLAELDLTQTLRNALARHGTGTPIRVREDDFEVFQTESRATCSIVLLLDMSGSMQRYGRFVQAKKCAMALHALVRQQFPRDTVDIIGFYSAAAPIPEHRLPLVMPKRVTIFDPHVRLKLPLERAADGPQHFTNLQLGLRLGRQVLRRRGGMNKLMLVITDGEPTAYVQGGQLHLVYPPDARTAAATLNEALVATAEGVRICTFALIDDYFYMDWVGFVDRLTKLTRGVSFYCHGGDLASCVMESYLSGKKRKAYFG